MIFSYFSLEFYPPLFSEPTFPQRSCHCYLQELSLSDYYRIHACFSHVQPDASVISHRSLGDSLTPPPPPFSLGCSAKDLLHYHSWWGVFSLNLFSLDVAEYYVQKQNKTYKPGHLLKSSRFFQSRSKPV